MGDVVSDGNGGDGVLLPNQNKNKQKYFLMLEIKEK